MEQRDVFEQLERAIASFPDDGRDLVHRALDVARLAHQGQTRDEGTPYLEHPARVAVFLATQLGITDPTEIAAALTHDVLEDSQMAAGELGRRTNPRVAEIVAALTKDKIASGLTGDARVAAKTARDNRYYQLIGNADAQIRRVKCADRIDNLRSLDASPEPGKKERYRAETLTHVLPIAKATDARLADEIERLAKG